MFKSFKSHYNDQCKKYIVAHPGRMITIDNIASFVGAAWSLSMTPANIKARFIKAGAFPLNPGVITHCQIAPSLAVRPSTKGKSPPLSTGSLDSGSSSSLKTALPHSHQKKINSIRHITKKAMTYQIQNMQNG